MGTVHQIDPNSKSNDAEVAMRELERAIKRAVELNVADDASFGDREAVALNLVNEGTRRFLEQELQEIADKYDDEVLIDGVLYKRVHEPAPGMCHSLCGALTPVRAVYRQVGVRNGPSVVPMELASGIVEGATPALAYSIALNLGTQHSREYVEGMSGAYRCVPSRSTVDRLAKAIGAKAQENAPRIERYLRQSEGAPEGSIAVSVGLDRVTVPYAEERPEGAAPKTRRKKRTKPYLRTPPPPIDVNYHMAYVGTVTFIDEYGDPIVTRKYVATHNQGPDDIVSRMMADIRAAKRHMPTMVVGLMQDGGPEMWNVMRGALDAEPSVDTYLEGIDRYHLDERLAEVLRITEPEPESRKEQLSDWSAEFDVDDSTIDRIEWYIIEKVFELQ